MQSNVSLFSFSASPFSFVSNIPFPLYPLCRHVRFCSEIPTKPGLCGCPPFFCLLSLETDCLKVYMKWKRQTTRRKYFRTQPRNTQNVHHRYRSFKREFCFFKAEMLMRVNLQLMTLQKLRFVNINVKEMSPDFYPETEGSRLLRSAGTSPLNYTDSIILTFWRRIFFSNFSTPCI